MRTKRALVAVSAAIAVAAVGGYLAGATGNPQPASAQSPPPQSEPVGDSMMRGHGGSTMEAEHARMMGDRALRRFPRWLA